MKLFSNEIRKTLVKALASKGGGHIGGSLSICDLLAVLYGNIMRYRSECPNWLERDYLVCSKGHAGPAIYATLALKGFFPLDWLDRLNMAGTKLPGHCDRLKVPGIDVTTGSLGQGLSIACGIAHGLQVQGKKQNVFCITGDGENDEGQIWEAAAYAPHYKLENLIAFVDWNKKQIDGSNEEVMSLGNLKDKYTSFGWDSEIIDGANISAIDRAIKQALRKGNGKPTMIILDTIKGAGIHCIETIENNHCIGVTTSLAERCMEELEREREDLLKVCK